MSGWLPLAAAFGAGLATIASPCVLPVLPALLGSSLGKPDPWRPPLVVLGFVAAFSALALAFGASAELLGLSAGAVRDVAAVALLGLGLLLLWPALWARLALRLGGVADLAQRFGQGGGRLGALALGASLGALWTPCAGPALASILALVAAATDPGAAAVLLVAYAAGAGGPMLAVAYGGQRLAAWLRGRAGVVARLRQGLGALILLTAGASLADVSSAWVAALTAPVESAQGQVTGRPAPELPPGRAWINSPPLTLQQLRGRPVLIDFWTWDCVNCVRNAPVIERLHRRFADRGLVVIGVHTPEFAHERPLDGVQAAVRRLGLGYAVVQDNDFGIWRAFGNRYWPAAWLIDADGRIVYRHEGEGGEARLAAAIEAALR
ncbi:cytochrome c biogenesis protein CcdA [Roseateles asaccharophilus]|uniref:Cytochrome c biogenesis protein CcdA/thiol-disulfide isomerase/thioredoxin n=1 Tax=Roseateles asaccharophilus TaxID=582607 RepID=A0ABU2A6P3_9BURK|nr:cytochrome c biogenesis protein CcdA [Roseateles asaccharophilus]MDR7332865.1 cytochrome c biogenesis protein CcdA/thiol-disulfide isomerase/thioredoxin [Roseateles asaccharophilus]